MTTPGLKFICRDSVAVSTDTFDHPFSSRFDEQDAFVIFDNVEVPRERLFIDCNLDVYNTVMKTDVVAEHHAADDDPGANQARIRLGAGDAAWPRRSMPFSRRSSSSSARSPCTPSSPARRSIAAEQGAREYGNGMWACDVRPLGALRAASAVLVSARQRNHPTCSGRTTC